MTMLTEAETVLYTKRLKEAEEAHHALSMGRGVASFEDQNGEKVSYNKADIGRLKDYIVELKVMLGLVSYGASGPMEVFF